MGRPARGTLVENSAAHIVRVLTEARRRRATFAEVTSTAQEQCMSSTLARRSWQVFTDPTCAGAYFTEDGDVPFWTHPSFVDAAVNEEFRGHLGP